MCVSYADLSLIVLINTAQQFSALHSWQVFKRIREYVTWMEEINATKYIAVHSVKSASQNRQQH